MGVADKIEQLREFPNEAGQKFRDQLDRARDSRERLAKQDGNENVVKGVDRSGVLTPIPRPTIVRSLADA